MANTNPEPERSVSTDEPVLPLAINHVGHTVPEIDAAVEWYGDVLGFSVVAPPTAIEAESGHFADIVADIVGDFDELRLAHLESGNGVGFELFEYAGHEDENARARNAGENWQARPGIHHVAVRHPDVDALAERIVENGGERVSEVWSLFPDQDYELVYTADPWDNLIEIYNRSYVQFFANQE